MDRKTFLQGSIILVAGEFLTRVLGFIYLGPLNKINPQFGGVNTYLLTPYAIFLLLATLGITNTLTAKLSSAHHEGNVWKYKKIAIDGLIFVLAVSTIISLFVIIAPGFVLPSSAASAEYYPQLKTSIQILGLTISIYSINTVIRCIFVSQGHLKIVSVSYVFEQIIKIAIMFGFEFWMYKNNIHNLGWSSYNIAISIGVSIIGTTILFAAYMYKAKIIEHLKGYEYHFKIGGPLALASLGLIYFFGGVYIEGFNNIDVEILGYLLPKSGFTDKEVLNIMSYYFTWNWRLVMLPVTIGGVFITMMIKHIQAVNMKRKVKELNGILNLLQVYSSLAVIFFLTGGVSFFILFYRDVPVAISMFKAQSLLIPFYLFRSIITTYSITLNKTSGVIKSTFLLFILKVILDFALYPLLGVNAMVAASIISIVISTVYMMRVDYEIFQFRPPHYWQKIFIFAKTVVVYSIILVISYLLTVLNMSVFASFIILSLSLAVASIIFFRFEILQFIKAK